LSPSSYSTTKRAMMFPFEVMRVIWSS
jgi:hypothetical protein